MEQNNIYTLIEEIFIHKEFWEYKEGTSWGKIFDSTYSPEFIKAYLGHAGTLPEPESLAGVLHENHFREIELIRYQHIVFTFFLGILVYNKCSSIKKAIDDKFCNTPEYQSALEKHQDKPFAYIWFLICLFHDLGYQFENDKKGEIRKFDTFAELSSACYLDNTLEGLLCNLSELSGVPDYFSLDLIGKYYNYRKEGMETDDHGIYGGMYLFRDLCKIRREHTNGAKKETGFWKDDLEKIFQLASSIVLCHNVFLPDIKDLKKVRKYEKYGLDELIRLAENVENGQYPYKMEDYPIFFLFCLVDSIEPIKVVKDVNLLHNIFWDIQEDSITVSTNLTCGCKDRILQNASSLKDWLCKTETEDCSVTIKF